MSTEPIFAQEINDDNWNSDEWSASDQPTYICGPIRIIIISIRRVCRCENCEHYYYLKEEKLIYFCVKNVKNSHSYNRGTDELPHYFPVEFWGRILSDHFFNVIQILIAAINPWNHYNFHQSHNHSRNRCTIIVDQLKDIHSCLISESKSKFIIEFN